LIGSSGFSLDSYIPVNTWSHLVITYSSTTPVTKIYINGRYITSDSTAFTIAQPAGVSMGNRYSQDTGFNGSIDEVKIYSYALTEDEVKTDYNHGVSSSLGSTPVQSSSSTPASLNNGLLGGGRWMRQAGRSSQ